MNRILLLFFVFFSYPVFAQNPLMIPDTLSGTNIQLTLKKGTYQFYSGINTNTLGANGNILGPTLLLNQGDLVSFTVNNQLEDTTTIHWHGMHVSPENDGGPHTTIAPGTTWNPVFTVLDKAATYWYHPHLHTKTNEHVSKGIAGMIIVRDKEEAALKLPGIYGVDDFPLVIQTKDFDVNKEIVVPSNSDDVVMVNATIDASLSTPAQVVRFRLLNGSSMRVFNIGLSNDMTFYQIASDGGLLTKPIALTRLQLAPGERAEILIDFSGKTGQKVFLKSYASEFPNGIYGATYPGINQSMTLTGYNPNPLNGSDFNILRFDVVSQTNNPVTTIPTALVTLNPIPEANSDITRNLTMSPVNMGQNQLNGDFVINDVPFNMQVINYTIPKNNTEIWSISNQSAIAHPFHIHDVQFFVLDRDGNTAPPSEQGRKDVILVKPQETVRFIAEFKDFASDDVPYMYHCHMLYHEDKGMMGQFLVKDQTSGIKAINSNTAFAIYPNPASQIIKIRTKDNEVLRNIVITDLSGNRIKEIDVLQNGQEININSLSKGMYFVRISGKSGELTEKLIIE